MIIIHIKILSFFGLPYCSRSSWSLTSFLHLQHRHDHRHHHQSHLRHHHGHHPLPHHHHNVMLGGIMRLCRAGWEALWSWSNATMPRIKFYNITKKDFFMFIFKYFFANIWNKGCSVSTWDDKGFFPLFLDIYCSQLLYLAMVFHQR